MATPLKPEQVDYLYPIVGARIYDKVIIFERKAKFGTRTALHREIKKRGEIHNMSNKSRLRVAELAATTRVKFESIMTLTYPVQFPLDGKQAKKHLNSFLTQMRRLHNGFEYLWFLEFQNRGAPHFHILTTLPSPLMDSVNRRTFATIWARIVCEDVVYSDIRTKKERSLRLQTYRAHAHRKAWETIRDEDGAVKYLVKYALKPWQKQVPKQYRNVGRYWGNSHKVRTSCQAYQGVDITPEEAWRLVDRYRQDLPEKLDIVPKVVFK